jgi:prepilin-type N-terminal cleavage/methylation domain-containing protein
MSAREHSGGFTLLEVIVALAIFALMAGVIFSSLQFAADAFDRTQRKIEDQATQRILFDQIKRQVGSLFPLYPMAGFAATEFGPDGTADPISQLAMSQVVLFHGEPEFMVFVTVAPLILYENPGLTVVRYGLAQDEFGTYYLGAMETRYAGQASFVEMIEAPIGRPLALVKNIHRVVFEYYGFDEAGGRWVWFPRWSGAEAGTVPQAVKIAFDDRYVLVPINATVFWGSPAAGVRRAITPLVGE